MGLLAGCKRSGGGPVDHKDPRSVARAALEAYKAKDIDALVELIPEAVRDRAKDAADQRDAALFDEGRWRYRSVRSWDGKLGAMRIKGSRLRLHYADLDGDEVAVVQLDRGDDGRWYFDDLRSPKRSAFDKWGEPLEMK